MVKKTLGLVFVFVFLAMPAFAEPISQEILDQARAQAGLFMDLKNALGLDWLDEYNAYLDNPTSSPEPSWASSVAELVGKNYLSDAFPDDFSITPSGQEVTISRTITSQGIKDALPIYLPSVAISGDTASLLVQRPVQWVSWEAALASKVSRAGDDDPDILPGASLEFGSGSEIEFTSGDGKLVGISSLSYKGEELEDRFVNAAGDNMTGPLTIGGSGNIVWHKGNDGSGSGLDADLLDGKDSSYYRDADKLDGQHGSFYRDASNLNTGTVPAGRLSGKYNIDISGDADTVDGKHASAFALAGHTHNYDDKYVNLTGDTMTGVLTAPEYNINNSNTRIYEGGNDAVRIRTPSGYVDIGPASTSASHFYTDRGIFYFNKPVETATRLKVYGTNTYLVSTEGRINNNIIWHKGNDGSGSGLDADLLDGKHASAFALEHGHPYVNKGGDTMTGVLTMSSGKYIVSPEYRINDGNTRIYEGGSNSVRIHTNSGYVDIGPANTSWVHFYTDRPAFYFGKPVEAETRLKVYGTNTYLTGSTGYIGGKRILTTDDIPSLSSDREVRKLLRTKSYTTPGTYKWTKGSGTTYVEVFVWGGGGSSASSKRDSKGGDSRFGSYVSATGGKSGKYPNPGAHGVGSPNHGAKEPYGSPTYGVGTYGRGGRNTTTPGGNGGFAWHGIDVSNISSVTVVVGRRARCYFNNYYDGKNGAVIVKEYMHANIK